MLLERSVAGWSGKTLFRWLKIGIIIYCLCGFALYYLQDYILFRPVQISRHQPYDFKLPHNDINIPFDKTSNLNIVQFLTPDGKKKGVVLYFHGNKKNISWYAKYAPYFTKHGYEVWMIDYPGFGKSTGKLTEQRLYDFAIQVYKLARTRFGKDHIIIYGKSMGTGIAAYLASVKDCKRLILETPYYSMHSLLGGYFPVFAVSRLIHYRLPTFEYLANVSAPVIIFHGSADGVIPYRNAQKLNEVLKPGDEFLTVTGGSHNDLYDFALVRNKLDSILASPILPISLYP
ncbi:MAG: alpha/beta fold hydrolase [Chitinophagaceae bacterium]